MLQLLDYAAGLCVELRSLIETIEMVSPEKWCRFVHFVEVFLHGVVLTFALPLFYSNWSNEWWWGVAYVTLITTAILILNHNWAKNKRKEITHGPQQQGPPANLEVTLVEPTGFVTAEKLQGVHRDMKHNTTMMTNLLVRLIFVDHNARTRFLTVKSNSWAYLTSPERLLQDYSCSTFYLCASKHAQINAVSFVSTATSRSVVLKLQSFLGIPRERTGYFCPAEGDPFDKNQPGQFCIVDLSNDGGEFVKIRCSQGHPRDGEPRWLAVNQDNSIFNGVGSDKYFAYCVPTRDLASQFRLEYTTRESGFLPAAGPPVPPEGLDEANLDDGVDEREELLAEADRIETDAVPDDLNPQEQLGNEYFIVPRPKDAKDYM